MTTRVKRNRIGWLVMRYPEHTKYLGEVFTLAELVERFFDSASALSIISKAFLPDLDDVEQIDKALLLRLWWLGDVESRALEVIRRPTQYFRVYSYKAIISLRATGHNDFRNRITL